MSKLRRLTKTNENGTNVYNIVNASNSLGLKAEAYKCEFDDLSKKDIDEASDNGAALISKFKREYKKKTTI